MGQGWPKRWTGKIARTRRPVRLLPNRLPPAVVPAVLFQKIQKMGRVQAEDLPVDVQNDGLGPRVEDGVGDGDHRLGGEDDFVARTDAQRGQSKMESRRPACRRDGVLDAKVSGEFLLEALDIASGRRDPTGLDAVGNVLQGVFRQLGFVDRNHGQIRFLKEFFVVEAGVRALLDFDDFGVVENSDFMPAAGQEDAVAALQNDGFQLRSVIVEKLDPDPSFQKYQDFLGSEDFPFDKFMAMALHDPAFRVDEQAELLGKFPRGKKMGTGLGEFLAQNQGEDFSVFDDFGHAFHEAASSVYLGVRSFLIRVNRSLIVNQTYFQPFLMKSEKC